MTRVLYRVLVYNWNGSRLLVDAHEMTEDEARNVLWTFVRKATQEMDDARAHGVFTVHAHRYEIDEKPEVDTWPR